MLRLAHLLLIWIHQSAGDLLRLSEAELGPGLPAGWQVRPVRGVQPPDVETRVEGASRVLRISGRGKAAWFARDLRDERPSDNASLRWTWRVLEAPAAADLRLKSTEDSPIRVFVVFGNPGALLGRSGRIIFYSFGNAEPAGYSTPSRTSDRMHVLRVDGASEVGSWRSHEVSPAEDYRRIWGRDAPAITAVGIMQDTDQTGASAVAELRVLSLDATHR